jgi:hypothetical protein
MKDYRSMEAGPEMDLAVWRAVMAHSDSDAFIEDRAEHLAPGEKPHLVVCWELEGGSFERWEPSSNIANAWRVIHQLQSNGFSWSVSDNVGPKDSPWPWGCSASFGDFTATAPPLFEPLAICRAALIAKSAP